ncbi:unnamed protein product [Cyberlindnera jadinii]|uniref:Uncharacterized protein n=1 Tax=Cyberlindnera jadinii (strain ATCC 18201 / CBS 1600 / BCRC 20928 / JCM 3617 / NBRC 0987 / NRRL Y-1542) TaxID=983966 RepID=A0A0H5C6M0_CYBJN|nr:unnamed protein product [Cyberlindnera jadinii]
MRWSSSSGVCSWSAFKSETSFESSTLSDWFSSLIFFNAISIGLITALSALL